MQTVRVRLRKPTRVFTFLSNDIALSREDDCIVRSDRGLEWGTCVTDPLDIPQEEEGDYPMSIVRRATPHDRNTLSLNTAAEDKARETCLRKIEERSLPMKLIDAEYTFDKKKIVFHFTADERVDFRELVRDLAHELKTRIELRHIQVRDEAKLVGGLGTCGRELCCATWLREFMPISMKMAKRQNLSLNPAKISGQCGRLMCCLAYENDQYSSAKAMAKARVEEAVKEAEKEAAEANTEEKEPADVPAPEVESGSEVSEDVAPEVVPTDQVRTATPEAEQSSRNETPPAKKKRRRRRRRRKKRPASDGGSGGNGPSQSGGSSGE